MHYFKKIISCFVLFAIISPCVIVESKAADYTSISNFWTWSSQYTWGLGDQLLGMASDSVCTESEDEKHHASSYQYDSGEGYYSCVCHYCGETFVAYESDISSAYDDYVSGIQSDLGTTTLIDGGVRVYFKTIAFDKSDATVHGLGTTSIHGTWISSSYSGGSTYRTIRFGFPWKAAPFNCMASYGYDFSGVDCFISLTIPDDLTAVSVGGQLTPTKITNSFTIDGESKPYYYYAVVANGFGIPISFSVRLYADLYPLDGSLLPTGQDITINSRPTSIIGDYGIIGDDGTVVKMDGNTIVNEADKMVYSPIIGSDVSYTDCVFDYADRSYTLTLEDGSTMKVVYGDENVTIEEGDTVYNVYYLTSGSEDGSGGSGGAGDDGSGGIGGAISGLFDVLGEIIYGLIEGTINLATKALSALTGLLDLLKQFGESIVGFFGGYLDFLGAVFPFLPEETFTILNLGLILMIAAAVFKKFL